VSELDVRSYPIVKNRLPTHCASAVSVEVAPEDLHGRSAAVPDHGDLDVSKPSRRAEDGTDAGLLTLDSLSVLTVQNDGQTRNGKSLAILDVTESVGDAHRDGVRLATLARGRDRILGDLLEEVVVRSHS